MSDANRARTEAASDPRPHRRQAGAPQACGDGTGAPELLAWALEDGDRRGPQEARHRAGRPNPVEPRRRLSSRATQRRRRAGNARAGASARRDPPRADRRGTGGPRPRPAGCPQGRRGSAPPCRSRRSRPAPPGGGAAPRGGTSPGRGGSAQKAEEEEARRRAEEEARQRSEEEAQRRKEEESRREVAERAGKAAAAKVAALAAAGKVSVRPRRKKNPRRRRGEAPGRRPSNRWRRLARRAAPPHRQADRHPRARRR